jgi:hypothetical protein
MIPELRIEKAKGGAGATWCEERIVHEFDLRSNHVLRSIALQCITIVHLVQENQAVRPFRALSWNSALED